MLVERREAFSGGKSTGEKSEGTGRRKREREREYENHVTRRITRDGFSAFAVAKECARWRRKIQHGRKEGKRRWKPWLIIGGEVGASHSFPLRPPSSAPKLSRELSLAASSTSTQATTWHSANYRLLINMLTGTRAL